MNRFFNTAGPIRRDDHYYIEPLDRFDLPEMLTLIEQKKYLMLQAPRQTGKRGIRDRRIFSKTIIRYPGPPQGGFFIIHHSSFDSPFHPFGPDKPGSTKLIRDRLNFPHYKALMMWGWCHFFFLIFTLICGKLLS